MVKPKYMTKLVCRNRLNAKLIITIRRSGICRKPVVFWIKSHIARDGLSRAFGCPDTGCSENSSRQTAEVNGARVINIPIFIIA
jgi:hypothetical protein